MENSVQQDCYRSLQQTSLKGFHCERHTYVNHYYEQLEGIKSIVGAHVSHGKAHISDIANQLYIEKEKATELDRETKLMIPHELDHCRIATKNEYWWIVEVLFERLGKVFSPKSTEYK